MIVSADVTTGTRKDLYIIWNDNLMGRKYRDKILEHFDFPYVRASGISFGG